MTRLRPILTTIVTGTIVSIITGPAFSGGPPGRGGGSGGQTARSGNKAPSGTPSRPAQSAVPDTTHHPAVQPRLPGQQAITIPQAPVNSSGNGGAQVAGNPGVARQKPIIDAARPINVAPPPNVRTTNPSVSGTVAPQPGAAINPGGVSAQPIVGGVNRQPLPGPPPASPPTLGGNVNPGGATGIGAGQALDGIFGPNQPSAGPPTLGGNLSPGGANVGIVDGNYPHPPPATPPQGRTPKSGGGGISFPDFPAAGIGGGEELPAGGDFADRGPVSVSASVPADGQQLVEDSGIDLELLDVRFVDGGDAARKLGPCYRVEFRNHSEIAITHPFHVALLAATDRKLTADAPRVVEEVPGMEAGQVLVGDLRLPLAASQMGRTAKGALIPFTRLFVVIDVDDEVPESNRDNNIEVLARDRILPVEKEAEPLHLLTIKTGGELVLSGKGFGDEPGTILLVVGGLKLRTEVVSWDHTAVHVRLPAIPLVEQTAARLLVTCADGHDADPLGIELLPAEEHARAGEVEGHQTAGYGDWHK